MRRFATGAVLVVLFVATLVLAGRVLIDGSEQRRIDATDGRAISIGSSWPGALDGCVSDASINVLPNCYREPVSRGSFIKQPWSAWSALSLCAVGLLVLADVDRSGSRSGAWLGAASIAAGFGGMLFHATLTSWGASVEVASTYALFTVVAVIDVLSLLHVHHPSCSPTSARSAARLLLALLLLAAAVVMLLLSGASAGDPIGLPLHATWHVLAALFVLGYWRYLPSEAARANPERGAPNAALA